jgi:Carboxypeptidase regulatory-like domain
MYTRKLAALFFSLSLVLASAPTLVAQSGAGSIQGTVTDPTGAVIPGASIDVVNVATGVATDTKSNGVGFYQVPGLFTGTYRVTITAPGMKSYITSIELLVAQSAVVNPRLTPGAVTQQVVVSGNAVQLVTTDNGAITSTLENARINQLPENGRLLTTLIQMSTPGLEESGQSVNGLMTEGLEYRIDGAETTNLHNGGEAYTQEELIDPDSIQEVQVATTNAGAQYQTPATAIVTTKSGTNRLHGTAFETARNNCLGIAKSRSDPSNLVAPEYIRNEFGASAGGPIVLPHIYHGKDKSFWFFAYERYSLANNSSAEFKVPTMAMRQGDFSGAVSSAGILQTIYDPSTTAPNANCPVAGSSSTSNNPYCRTPFAKNTIPAGEESPDAAILYATMPQPTSAANPLVENNLTAGEQNFSVDGQWTFRLDHVFNENNRAYLRFTDNNSASEITNNGAERSVAATVNGVSLPAGATEGYLNQPAQSFIASAGYTHIFSPTFYAETVAAEQWFYINQLRGYDASPDYESKLGMPNNFGESGVPTVSGLIDSLVSSQTAAYSNQIIWNLDENLTKIVGRHQLHFGEHWQHYRDAERPEGMPDAIAFGANPTGLYESSSANNYDDSPNSGIDDASFFLGSAGSYTVYLPVPHAHFHWDDIAAYLQDDYHVSKNLTFNIGLRYEAHPGVWVKYGLNNTIDFKTGAIVTQAPPSTLVSEGYTTQAIITNLEDLGVVFETPQEAGMPAKLLRNYDLNFLPRAGFAYQFSRKFGTVVRGAFGRYTEAVAQDGFINQAVRSSGELYTADWVQSYSTAAQAIDGLPNELLRYNDPVKFGVLGVNTSNVVNTNATNSILPGFSQWADDPNWAPAYISETNFTIEQPFKGNSVLRVSWVWTHSSNLEIAHDFNLNPTTYQWEMAHGVVPPTGGPSVIGTPLQDTYSTTATGPYNQTIYGSGSSEHVKTGWMNYNALQVNYQRLFHHGFAYQIYYVFSKDLRAGGSVNGNTSTLGSTTDPYADFPGAEGTVATMTSPYGTIGAAHVAPPPPSNVALWQNYHALNHFELYSLDNETPIHHIQFNGIYDLPVGRGKWLLGNANRFLNELVGGFQIAGDGSVVSQVFQGPTAHWGAESPIKVYKHKYPIVDCSSGVCYKEFLWDNGYLSPEVTTGVAGSVCTTNCITGLPADYVPDQAPIDNTPGTTYFGDDEVQIQAPTLNSGALTNVAYDAGPLGTHYGAHTFLNGPMNWEADASIFKVFPIKEGINLRVDMDAFNVFNHQGYNNPNTTTGEEEVEPGVGVASSYNTPRQIQITARLTF